MYLTINVDESDTERSPAGNRRLYRERVSGSVFEGKIDQVRLNPITQQGIVVLPGHS